MLRQSRVGAGQAQIDQAFSGFDDAFYQGVTNDFVGALTPQLTRSFDDAYRQLTLQMAASGNSESSSAARKFGRLYERQKDTLADIQSQGLDRAAGVRSQTEGLRRDLVQQNSVAADPSQAAAAARSAASSVAPPSALPSLGDVFGDIVQGATLGYGLNSVIQGRRDESSAPPLKFGNATGKIVR
jgi:hypothetical protein